MNAGHPAGYVFNANSEIKARLTSDCLPLGLQRHSHFSNREPLGLEAGDLLLLLTDGILEAQASDGPLFGEERVLRVVRQNCDKPANAIVEALREAISDFLRGKKQSDDVTAVVIKVETLP